MRCVERPGLRTALLSRRRHRQCFLSFDINYKGRAATLDPNTPNVAAPGMGALISSIRVPPGETWQVCTEPNFRGRCQNLTNDASDLRRGDWNDVIASVRRIR